MLRQPFRTVKAQRTGNASGKKVGTIRAHAQDIVARHLFAVKPENDGKQTPLQGH